MTTNELIDDILRREGGFSDHASDRGSFTKFGITATTLGQWRQLGRQATRAEVYALTEQEARDIYVARYVVGPKFDRIVSESLRALMVDWGVHSGPATAITALQRVLDVTADGVIGQETLRALATTNGADVYRGVLRARGLFLADLMQRDRRQRDFAVGWLRRLMEFV